MAKQQSLAAQSGALSAPAFDLPAVFSAPQTEIKAREVSPYVTFAHPNRKDEWAKLVGKLGTVNEGDMFLMMQDNFVKLDKMKCYWLRGEQYWARTNASGEVLETSLKELPHPWKEHIEAVVLVILDDRIVPANIQFRTTKCPAGKVLHDALSEAQTPGWLDKSPQHKETGIVTQPFFRFYGLLELSPQRTSRASGLPYRTTVCTVHPTGMSDWRLIEAFSKDPECNKALTKAAERFEFRRNEVKSKLVK